MMNFEIFIRWIKIIGDYLDKTILKPNNLSQPLSRKEFLNILK